MNHEFSYQSGAHPPLLAVMTTCKGEEHDDVNGHKLEEMGNGHMLITPQ